MDRKKEGLEENKIKTKLENLITPTAATNILSTSNTTPTDDDASTESSDCLESWTLVNDKNNKLRKQLEDKENRVEVLKNSDNDDEEEEENDEFGKEEVKLKNVELKDSLTDANNSDDFSDGISIISESESVGRISPHPYLRDHLHDMNLKFTLGEHMDDSIINKLREEMDHDIEPLVVPQPAEPVVEQQIRQRRRSSTFKTDENQALQKASQTVAISSGFSPLVKRGLQGIFYVGVALAILALIGKIVHPTWQPLSKAGSSSDTSAELEQKVNDMELQNNLMRAEIDLLNKQVKYLSSLNDPQQQYQQKQGKYKDYKEGKTFKAWAGNGDSLKPVEISKQDLRKPYKCPDGSFVEIANMCMEQSNSNEPNIVEQFGHVVEDLKQQSEAFKTFEKVAEELQGFQDNPFEQLQEVFAEQKSPEAAKKEFIKNKPIYETPQDYQQNLPPKEKYQKYPNHKEDSYSSKPYKTNKYEEQNKPPKDYKKSFGKDDKHSKEFKKYQHNNPDNSKDNSKEWHTDKFNNNSKERKYRRDNSKDFDNSHENSRENQSKERFNKQQKRKYDKSREKNNGDDDDASGEWQEKYMKHREQLRKQNEQKYQDNNKNWYIKRGDSREHKRSGEKQYR
ncbi:hypothetical protein CVS40_3489 [Lucilia cuprina]|nr:hypothetical protein CVS40_3489 [Lucilia cuprina]KAI8126563.1 hypothetical protein CVS40_3489 [Lucilia cuprina]